VVCRRNVVNAHDLFRGDVTEHRDFLHGSGQQWLFASASDLRVSVGACGWLQNADQVGQKTKTSEIPYTCLCRFRLLLSANDGNEGNVYQSEVLGSNSELELSHGLDERCRFDITDCTTKLLYQLQSKTGYLDNTDIRLLSCLIHWHL